MKQVRLIVAVLCAVLCASGCINEKLEGADLKVGDRLPDFSVVMDDGTTVSDEILKGNISCVVFFHTSCPDCQKTLPVVQEIYNEYASENIIFTLISREQTADEIDVFWKEKSLNMPYSAQSDRKVYNLFAQTRIPRIYMIDKDGIIRYIFTDDPIPSYDDLMSSIESLIR